MSEELKKSIVRRIWKESWQEGNLGTIDELVDANHILHAYPEDLAFGSGTEGLKCSYLARCKRRANIDKALNGSVRLTEGRR